MRKTWQVSQKIFET